MIIVSIEDRHKCWFKRAVEIRRRGEKAMNRDEGVFMLSHT